MASAIWLPPDAGQVREDRRQQPGGEGGRAFRTHARDLHEPSRNIG